MRVSSRISQPARPAREAARLCVGFLLAPSFTLTAFATFIDTLRLAADEGDKSRPIDIQWEVMNPCKKPIKTSCGFMIEPTADLSLPPQSFDYVVIVGGLLADIPLLDQRLALYLHAAAAANVPLIGAGTGGFILSNLGLMAGRKCCVSWFHYQNYVDRFPTLDAPVADRLYVIDGDRITCCGGTAAADLAGFLVAQRFDTARAKKALNILLIDRMRPDTGAQPAPALAAEHDDDRISRAMILMEQHLAEPLSVPSIAARLGISKRQLERTFRSRAGATPAQIYMTIRLTHAEWYLVHTPRSLVSIAAQLGFVDGTHLSRYFKRHFGIAPMAYRRQSANRPQEREDSERRRIFDA